jgi:hypothetical protein
MSFMSVGYDQLEDNKREFLPDRFWIPTGQSREIVFIDSLPAVFKEHNAKLNGSWKNWLTCAAPYMSDGDLAPCCSIIGEPYQVAMYTIIDCSSWTDKKGNSRQYEIKVLPAKYKTAMKLKRKNGDLQPEGKSLSGRLYKVVRETDKSPSVGDEYEYVRDVDVSKLFSLVTFRGKKLADLISQAHTDPKVFETLHHNFNYTKDVDGNIPRRLQPFNYAAIYEPKQPKDLRLLLRNFKPEDRQDSRFGGGHGGGGSSSNDSGADETVPF